MPQHPDRFIILEEKNMTLEEKLKQTADYIRAKNCFQPQIGIILGSGLGAFAEKIEINQIFDYADIPHFSPTSVSGHKGRLIFGNLFNKQIAVLQGRIHYYEGYTMDEVVFPARLLAYLGIRAALLTNAAGGIAADLSAGDIVIIRDHLNLLFNNPLIGRESLVFGPRFPDMTNVYADDLQQILIDSFQENEISPKTGVYACLSGPAYETPAEVKMLKILGADLVGMSTVPEAIALHQMGVKVAALSVVANKAAGLSASPLSHSEVESIARHCEHKIVALISEFIKRV